MTQESGATQSQPGRAGKLQLPHGTAQTAAIDVAQVDSATLIERDGQWVLIIVLKNGTKVEAPATDENVACLEALGIFVSRAPNPSNAMSHAKK